MSLDSIPASEPEAKPWLESDYSELAKPYAWLFSIIAILWVLFQLWIASPLPFKLQTGQIFGVEARAVHLGFALVLCFLVYPSARRIGQHRPSLTDILFLLLAMFVTSYLVWNHDAIAQRGGELLNIQVGSFAIPVEVIIGSIGISLLLLATKRVIGWPLVVICLVFLLYSLFGRYMPEPLDHRGVSFQRLIGYHWLGAEAVFGIPIKVTTDFIFLFVLFGALLNRAGAGQYFIDLAFAAVGKYRGGPAKASVLASGLTGTISGSSIANTVTTGTFTIPVMKKSGMPATKAGAIEVAASTDSQIMPPIMGAAAFVMAEFLGLSYSQVIIHALIPALMSYIGLFYVTHLEALKLNLQPLSKEEVPTFRQVFWKGAHFLLPVLLLVYLLLGFNLTTTTAVFWAVICLMGVILLEQVFRVGNENPNPVLAVAKGIRTILLGMIDGARNMISVSVAVAAAGIIVGAVASTGLSNAMIGIVEIIAGGNVYILLVLTAVLCLLLGMGLPTTANYLVVASIMAPVLSQLGQAAGLELPLIAVHLFVFYFGLMADVTPPVGLAAYAASAISRADPVQTGIQAFIYSMRTAILPFVFIFNLDLILYKITNPLEVAVIFVVGIIAIMAFTTLTFRWFVTRLNWLEILLLSLITAALMRPDFVMNQIYPKYETVSLKAFEQGVQTKALRLYIERTSDYGTRKKLVRFDHTDNRMISSRTVGLSISAEKISDTHFMGLAEKRGLQAGDRIVKIEKFNPGQPDKKLVYIPALFILILLIWSHIYRARRARNYR